MQKTKLQRENGFTFIEIIAVVVLIGILAYVAVARLNDSHKRLQLETVVRKITSDTRFAQQLALTQRTGTRIYIDQTNNRYYLKWESGAYIENPVGGSDFIIQFGQGKFRDVTITGTAFTGGRLDFDSVGSPLNAGAAFSGTLTLVTFNNSKRIRITANTGLLSIEDF
ncbi:MAG: Tfp pilus assembly protein FimT/FimU [bacterium]